MALDPEVQDALRDVVQRDQEITRLDGLLLDATDHKRRAVEARALAVAKIARHYALRQDEELFLKLGEALFRVRGQAGGVLAVVLVEPEE